MFHAMAKQKVSFLHAKETMVGTEGLHARYYISYPENINKDEMPDVVSAETCSLRMMGDV